jgi:hypothetical protein
MAAKEWKKTVVLSNGEVILDISGDWDNQVEFYGPFNFIALVQDFVQIKQEDTTFTGAVQVGSQ